MLLLGGGLFVLATAHMDWPDLQSVASWPSLHEDRAPTLARAPRARMQPSLVELQRLKGGGAPSTSAGAVARTTGGKALSAALVAYPLIGLSFLALLSLTLWHYPLGPFQLDSLAWCRAWLLTTVADYYGACLCLCGVIVASEPLVPGLLWCAACCFLGTPGCCAYVFGRLLRHGSLQLAQRAPGL